mmetsp:Transcript_47903/g.133539  ORF Transcript_47903/g.133539 Transcript_47903/m.133539 type:complete len:273 (+) Transcript_47903:119-937(+)
MQGSPTIVSWGSGGIEPQASASATTSRLAQAGPPTTVQSSSAYEDTLSIEELGALLQERDAALTLLRSHIATLRAAPEAFAQRLARLEASVLGGVADSSVLEVQAQDPQVIKDAIRKNHRVQQNDPFGLCVDEGHSPGSAYTAPRNLVAGQGFMSLDRKALEIARLQAELDRNKHPAITEDHYAGHLSLPVAQLATTTVDVRGAPPHSAGFWLDPPASVHPAAPERWACRGDLRGDGEDALPIDWLGRAKRGLPAKKPSLRHSTGAAPPWLY